MNTASLRFSTIAIYFLTLCLQPAICQSPKNSQTVSANPSDLAENIRQTVTRVVAYGETARICNAQLANDQAQIHDLDSRIRDSNDRIADLSSEAAKITAHPPVDAYQYKKIQDQYSDTKTLLKKQTDDRDGLYTDLGKQQKCIEEAKNHLAALTANPDQAATAGKDGQK